MVLEATAAGKALARERQEPVARQHLQLLDGEVACGVLRLLVDHHVEVGHPQGERALDARHLVHRGHRPLLGRALQAAGALHAVGDAPGGLSVFPGDEIAHPVGAIKHRHDVPLDALRLRLGGGGLAGLACGRFAA